MSPTPRVLMVSSLPLGAPWNGADKTVARTIVSADSSSRYIVQTGPNDPWPEHVEPIRESSIPLMPGAVAQLKAARYLVRHAPRSDLVHVVASIRRASRPAAAGIRAWSSLSRRGVVHSVPSLTPEWFDRRTLIGDITVVFSEHSKQLLESLGVENVVHLFPPVDLAALPPREDAEEVRRRLDLGPLPILYATHLDEGNGVAEAIRALARLPKPLAEATLVLSIRSRAGQEVESTVAELRALARDNGVEKRIRWLTHVMDMPSLISACALTALVPRTLAGKMDLPLVLLESLALGRPIIVSDQPPIAEALLGGGLEARFGNVDELATALAALLDDDRLRTRLATEGRARLLELADPMRCAAAYGEIYRELARSRTNRSKNGERRRSLAANPLVTGLSTSASRVTGVDIRELASDSRHVSDERRGSDDAGMEQQR